MFGDRAFPAVYFGNRYFAPAGDAAPEPEPAPAPQPAAGWSRLPPSFSQPQTAEARRLERERLGIEPKQQRAIDRAAVKIAASYPQAGLLAPPQVIAAPAFDRLLGVVQPTEGQIMALAQAILDRLAWMAAEQEEEEAVVRLMMEMD